MIVIAGCERAVLLQHSPTDVMCGTQMSETSTRVVCFEQLFCASSRRIAGNGLTSAMPAAKSTHVTAPSPSVHRYPLLTFLFIGLEESTRLVPTSHLPSVVTDSIFCSKIKISRFRILIVRFGVRKPLNASKRVWFRVVEPLHMQAAEQPPATHILISPPTIDSAGLQLPPIDATQVGHSSSNNSVF
jgi:hypothetical protein